jgi:hypothetical protein
MEGGCLVGEVLLADRFGNLITNLDAGAAGAGHVRVGGVDVGPVRRTFGDVPAGTLVAYVGSGGTIEIAVRDGSAATRLAATRATDVRVEPD